MVVTYFFPQSLLWVLGPQYSNLRFEVQLAVAASAVSFFSSVMWCIHTARKFVYWWNVGLSIGLTLVVQALFIAKIDMSTVRGVLWLTIATNVASLFINVLSGAYGFIKGPRETEEKHVIVPDNIVEAEPYIDLYSLEEGSVSLQASQEKSES
jgi:hypothetical protein